MDNIIIFDLSTEGLDPLKHRIIGITLKTAKEEKIITYKQEDKILSEFWDFIRINHFDKLIGFNSERFDMPFLMVRSLKHRIPVVNLKGKSLDLRKVLSGTEEKKKGSLKDFKELLGIEFPDNGFGKMHMSLLWSVENIEDLERHNNLDELEQTLLQDVIVTWELYKHTSQVGLV